MDKNKLKEFWNDHKKEILIGTGVAIFGGAVYVVTKKKPKINVVDTCKDITKNVFSISPKEQARIDAFDCKIGTVTGMWNEGGYLNVIINDVSITDIGDLGKEFLKLDEVNENTKISLVAGMK